MKIYPAIDIKSGQCVRLYQGSYEQVTVYHQYPLTVAQFFAAEGAEHLHVVDLDGAKAGKPIHLSLIEKLIQQSGLKIQTGGGIRNRESIEQLLQAGVSRVILGSVAVTDVTSVKTWLKEFGRERIVLALDVRLNQQNIPYVATHGWQTNQQKNMWDLLDDYRDALPMHVLCTDIQCDGTLLGPNLNLYQECLTRFPTIEFQASGGIGTLADIKKLSEMKVAGVIIGKALYENKFTLRSAISEVASC